MVFLLFYTDSFGTLVLPVVSISFLLPQKMLTVCNFSPVGVDEIMDFVCDPSYFHILR